MTSHRFLLYGGDEIFFTGVARKSLNYFGFWFKLAGSFKRASDRQRDPHLP